LRVYLAPFFATQPSTGRLLLPPFLFRLRRWQASFTGVHINGPDIDNGVIPNTYNFSSAAEADMSFGHVIRNNLITKMGLHVTYGGGIYVHQSHSVLVESNEISWSQRNREDLDCCVIQPLFTGNNSLTAIR